MVAFFALALAILVAPTLARAQPVAPTTPVPLREAEAEKRERERELAAVRAEIERLALERARIEREVAAIARDRASLIRASIEAANRARSAEERASATETRLADLDARERALRASLEARRGLLAEVLASLQRMGRRPPPALLAAPDDILKSVRTAMMLGALLPEMREATRALVANLEQLASVRRGIAVERDRLRVEVAELDGERLRLAALAEARQKALAESQTALDAERLRAVGLSRQSANLEQLIGRMETEIQAAARAAELARTTTAARAQAPTDRRAQMAALQNAARMSPALPFEQARGALSLPVSGVRLREFGAADGLGGTERGLTLASRAGATVTAPADGWVVYSGPFRGYGQLLILNAGGGYHLVLAGMERVSVDLGQFVLAGEPVATMGQTASAATAGAAGSAQPMLYVEFRKDGVPIDPAPWWMRPARATNERTRG